MTREQELEALRDALALIEKIARCEVPSSNEFATRIQHWCHEFMERHRPAFDTDKQP